MNWWKKTQDFLSEVRAEMKKVTFPAREEVIATTIVVIVTSFVFAVFLWIADILILKGYGGIFEALGS